MAVRLLIGDDSERLLPLIEPLPGHKIHPGENMIIYSDNRALKTCRSEGLWLLKKSSEKLPGREAYLPHNVATAMIEPAHHPGLVVSLSEPVDGAIFANEFFNNLKHTEQEELSRQPA